MTLKRMLSALFAFTFLFGVVPAEAFAADGEGVIFEPDPGVIDMTKTRKTSDIAIRDPFVLVYGQKYFLYGTGAAAGPGYGCYVSEDLENWAGPVNVFTAPEGFDGNGCFWAPECHYHNGNFYLFATYLSRSSTRRGVSVFRSQSPLGPFEELSGGHVTPFDWDSIDGTLYIDGDGQPWMVFVHEWTSTADNTGTMAAAKMNDDLTGFAEEPVELFKADDPLWLDGRVTDGPFLYRTNNGRLLMLWSNFNSRGYCVARSLSRNGEITGEWSHGATPLYAKNGFFDSDGGHAMLFTDLDGRLLMCMHSPNKSSETVHETAVFLEVVDTGNSLELEQVRQLGLFKRLAIAFSDFLREAADRLQRWIRDIV